MWIQRPLCIVIAIAIMQMSCATQRFASKFQQNPKSHTWAIYIYIYILQSLPLATHFFLQSVQSSAIRMPTSTHNARAPNAEYSSAANAAHRYHIVRVNIQLFAADFISRAMRQWLINRRIMVEGADSCCCCCCCCEWRSPYSRIWSTSAHYWLLCFGPNRKRAANSMNAPVSTKNNFNQRRFFINFLIMVAQQIEYSGDKQYTVHPETAKFIMPLCLRRHRGKEAADSGRP